MENVHSTREEDSYFYTRTGFTVASLCPDQRRVGRALDILENKNKQTNQTPTLLCNYSISLYWFHYKLCRYMRTNKLTLFSFSIMERKEQQAAFCFYWDTVKIRKLILGNW